MSQTLELLKSQGKIGVWFSPRSGSLIDQSGNGNVFTIASTGGSFKNTKYGRAFQNSGTMYFTVSDGASNRLSGKGTIIVFGDFDNSQAGQVVLAKRGATSNYQIAIEPTSIALYDGATSTVTVNPLGMKFFAVALQSAGTKPQFYKDGAFVSDGSATSTFPTNTETLYIGQFGGGYNRGKILDIIICNEYLTAEQISDIYNELMAERGSGDPKTTNFHASAPVDTAVVPADGAERVADGDMEAATTASWTAGDSATLSKQTGTRTGGSGTKVLRVARNGVNDPYALQSLMFVVGKRYRLVGWARSDGTGIPKIYDSGGYLLWAGSTSTSWVQFDFVFTALGTHLDLFNIASAGTAYVEFDDISLKETVELVADGNMEATGTGSWTAYQSTLSKQTTNPYSGTQVLRIGYDNTNVFGYGYQTILTSGKRYRVTGQARSTAACLPVVYVGTSAAQHWTGTNSSSWQSFDITMEANGTRLGLGASGLTTNHYVEFDSVSVKEVKCLLHWDMTTLTGDGKMLDRSGNGRHGTISQAQKVYSAPFDCLQFNGSLTSNVTLANGFTNTLSGNQNAAFGVWLNTDSLASAPVFLCNSNGALYMEAAANVIYVWVGASQRAYAVTGIGNNKWVHIYFEKTGSGDLGNLYVNNVLQPSYTGSIGDMPTVEASSLIAGSAWGGAAVLSGKLYDLRLYSSNLTTAERTKLYLDGAKRLVKRDLTNDMPVTLANVTAGTIPGTNIEVLTGTHKISQDATGKKWIEPVAAGLAVFQSKQAYGTWLFDITCAVFGSDTYFMPIASTKALLDGATQNGYAIYFSQGQIYIFRTINGTTASLGATAAGYLTAGVQYRICMTRAINGLSNIYVKGGVYTSWTLALTYTENTHTTSNYGIINLYSRKYSGFLTLAGVIDPTSTPELIPS